MATLLLANTGVILGVVGGIIVLFISGFAFMVFMNNKSKVKAQKKKQYEIKKAKDSIEIIQSRIGIIPKECDIRVPGLNEKDRVGAYNAYKYILHNRGKFNQPMDFMADMTNNDTTLADICIDPSTLEAQKKRFVPLSKFERLLYDALMEVISFDAPDLDKITFIHNAEYGGEYDYYESMLLRKLKEIMGITSVLHEGYIEKVVGKGWIVGGEYARALKIMKYRYPTTKKFKYISNEERDKETLKKYNGEIKYVTGIGYVTNCKHCGTETSKNAKFCTNCGKQP